VFRLNDATVISIPGSKGTDWRIHAIYDPASCRLIKVQVTDASGGERLDRHEYGHNEVVVGDRGLARARGIHSVAEDSAYCLLRMHWQNIRILDSSFKKPNLDEVLQRAKEGDRGTDIYVPLKGKPPIPARLIVQPLPKDQAEKARKKLRRNAAKKSRIPGKQALLLAGYFCVITTLPKEIVSDEVIMELYRIRWQIELFFKRCKSLLRIDELRADDPLLVKTYCTCKLIEAALVELLASEGETFSPWGVPRKRISACQ
jgi:IS4 transposase